MSQTMLSHTMLVLISPHESPGAAMQGWLDWPGWTLGSFVVHLLLAGPVDYPLGCCCTVGYPGCQAPGRTSCTQGMRINWQHCDYSISKQQKQIHKDASNSHIIENNSLAGLHNIYVNRMYLAITDPVFLFVKYFRLPLMVLHLFLAIKRVNPGTIKLSFKEVVFFQF